MRRLIAGTNRENTKTRCIFQDGASILVANFLASFIRLGDELTFATVKKDSLGSDSQILIFGPSSGIRRRHLLQATIGYASLPRKDKREKLYVSAGVENPSLGISRIHLPCKTLRDYFYVGNRHQGWEQQPSFYALLRVDSTASTAELNLAFKLRCLELRSGKTDAGKIASVERAFNILGRPELRACYDSLLADPECSTLFPYGGFGALLVAGEL
ncbi:MAG TPA: hypothetical protein VNO32_51490, partial [Candidatus Acidoferrum sp.]|nr:hypothetical protein [Candidatus Acidoferrum sp.]